MHADKALGVGLNPDPNPSPNPNPNPDPNPDPNPNPNLNQWVKALRDPLLPLSWPRHLHMYATALQP